MRWLEWGARNYENLPIGLAVLFPTAVGGISGSKCAGESRGVRDFFSTPRLLTHSPIHLRMRWTTCRYTVTKGFPHPYN